jgi:NADPH:quinone reductase-like Zn-dependent oxidoreductase
MIGIKSRRQMEKSSCKALVMHQYGGPEVLQYEQTPDLIVHPGEVLIHVAATSVNPFDLKLRSSVAAVVS